jgi:DNA-binding NtrC family response regulator
MPTILVVDDEPGMREALTRLLIARGHPALSARTAEEALDLVALMPDIHVVVADIEMPGNGGGWLVEQLAERFPQVAVVLATVDSAVPGTISLKPSVVSYLVKPITGEQLADAVVKGLIRHEQFSHWVDRSAKDAFDSWLDRKPRRGNDNDPGH